MKLFLTILKKDYTKNFLTTNLADDNTTECNNEKIYFTISYVEGISHKFKYIFKDDPMISMAYTGLNRLSRFIRAQKDKLQQESRSNVVYRIVRPRTLDRRGDSSKPE